MNVKHVLTVMTRLASRKPDQVYKLKHIVETKFESIVDSAIDVAIETGPPLDSILADVAKEKELSDTQLIHIVKNTFTPYKFHLIPLPALSVTTLAFERLLGKEESVEHELYKVFPPEDILLRLAVNDGYHDVSKRELYFKQCISLLEDKQKESASVIDKLKLSHAYALYANLKKDMDLFNSSLLLSRQLLNQDVKEIGAPYEPDLLRAHIMSIIGFSSFDIDEKAEMLKGSKKLYTLLLHNNVNNISLALADVCFSIGLSNVNLITYSERIDSLKQAVDIYEELYIQKPYYYEKRLYDCLKALAEILNSKLRFEESVEINRKISKLFRPRKIVDSSKEIDYAYSELRNAMMYLDGDVRQGSMHFENAIKSFEIILTNENKIEFRRSYFSACFFYVTLLRNSNDTDKLLANFKKAINTSKNITVDNKNAINIIACLLNGFEVIKKLPEPDNEIDFLAEAVIHVLTITLPVLEQSISNENTKTPASIIYQEHHNNLIHSSLDCFSYVLNFYIKKRRISDAEDISSRLCTIGFNVFYEHRALFDYYTRIGALERMGLWIMETGICMSDLDKKYATMRQNISLYLFNTNKPITDPDLLAFAERYLQDKDENSLEILHQLLVKKPELVCSELLTGTVELELSDLELLYADIDSLQLQAKDIILSSVSSTSIS